MKIRILFIKNNLPYSVAWDVEKFRSWLAKIGLEAVFEIKMTDIPLSFKDFGIKGLWGLDGIKEKIRQEGIVKPLTCDIVFFLYDAPKEMKNLANWCYPSHLISGEAFAEIVYKPEFVGRNGDVLIHESLHAFQRLLQFRGIYFVDTLDIDNNTDRVVDLYKPYFDKMLTPYPIKTQIWLLTALLNFFKSIMGIKKKEEELKIRELIKQIALEQDIDLTGQIYKDGLAVLICESNLNPLARGVNKDKSVDRGIAQWNNKWWPDISDAMAYNPEVALRKFWQIFPKHPEWWICYKKIKGLK